MEEHVIRFVEAVRERGVIVHAPQTIDVSPEVDPQRFEAGAILHAGTRIRGARTLVLAGAELGREAPATLEDAMVGRGAKVAGGFVQGAVLLDGAELGSAAQVRPGTVMEEGARAAHAVGMKHTILLPWATLGSLINFCDCLLSGGSAPRDHSEVGSGFIHFNFTPRGPKGDKATPSLFGDVPRGVLLRSPRVFLGGDGGAVGPMTVGFGATLGAGSTYRRDCPEGILRAGEAPPVSVPSGSGDGRGDRRFDPLVYGDVRRKWRLNLLYIGNLIALWRWYTHVRLPSASLDDRLAMSLLAGARDNIAVGIAERGKRLGDLVSALRLSLDRLPSSVSEAVRRSQEDAVARWPELERWLSEALAPSNTTRDPNAALRDRFLESWAETAGEGEHIARVRALSEEGREAATAWLDAVVAEATAFSSRP